tara:strand:+ start:1870 stop:3495 length:1626 start_codon:yes stop_codon:yes gene_type:complete
MTDKQIPDAYLGNPNLKPANVPVHFTPEQVEEYLKCQKDPIYFIENYVKIITLDKGVQPFKPWDFQKELLSAVHQNRFVITKYPRQSGKSTSVIAYILHYILFNQQVTVGMLANKLATARELLSRLKLAYENLPKWMQQGVEEWNKSSIDLENGSRVLASSTSSTAVRGGSFNMIFLDEFAYVPQEVAEEFFSSVYPTISSGKSSKVLIVSTPKGLNLFYKLWTGATEGTNDYVPVEVHWSQVPGRDAEWKKQTIANTSEQQFRVEFECDFIGSMNTLIAPSKLKTMAWRKPAIKNADGLDIYEKPKKDHVYAMTVDTSRGVGIDHHAFTIIDVTQQPYKLVAKYRNNILSPLLYPNIIYRLATEYNDAHVLIELNDIGESVANTVYEELEYDNVIMTTMKGRGGQVAGGGFGPGRQQRGVKTTNPVKKVGCSILKSLIEEDKLVLEDYDILHELTTFVENKGSYAADQGHHDDLVMCLVLFGWLTKQTYFKDQTDLDIRKMLYEKQMKEIEEDMTPFGFLNDGQVDVQNEDLPPGWSVVE